MLLLRLVILKSNKKLLFNKVLTNKVLLLLIRFLNNKDAGSNILAIILLLIAFNITFISNGQRLYNIKLATTDVL